MAANEKKTLMGYDPLAWLSQDGDDVAVEELIAEVEVGSDALAAKAGEVSFVDDDSPPESGTVQGFDEEAVGADFESDVSFGLPDGQFSNEPAATEDSEPVVNLDVTLTIQNVGKLYELLKKSYSAYNAIEINAAQVSSIDTATLQLLVALKKDAVKRQKSVVFTAPSRRFIESAELLGLLELLEIGA